MEQTERERELKDKYDLRMIALDAERKGRKNPYEARYEYSPRRPFGDITNRSPGIALKIDGIDP